jgi:TPR repeat protein
MCLALCLCVAAPAVADFAAGERAYRAGDYPTALRELEPYARAGNARAQYFLGEMYTFGGSSLHPAFPSDDEKAIYWLDLAVEQKLPTSLKRSFGLLHARCWQPSGL